MKRWKVWTGDCREVLPRLDAEYSRMSRKLIVSDAPMFNAGADEGEEDESCQLSLAGLSK